MTGCTRGCFACLSVKRCQVETEFSTSSGYAPVHRRKIVERQHRFLVLHQALCRLGTHLASRCSTQLSKALQPPLSSIGHPDLVQGFLDLRLCRTDFGTLLSTFAVLCTRRCFAQQRLQRLSGSGYIQGLFSMPGVALSYA